MPTHHRRTVNNPFANRSHRTVGYSDHRYGNSHHHNKQSRGRKGSLLNNATCCIIFLCFILFFTVPSSNLDDHSPLDHINPDKEKPTEQQSLRKEFKKSEEPEQNDADKTIDKSSGKHIYSPDSPPEDDTLADKSYQDNESNEVIENMYREVLDHEDEEKPKDSGGISNSIDLNRKNTVNDNLDFGEPQPNETYGGAVGDSDHEEELNKENFELGENGEPRDAYKVNTSNSNDNPEENVLTNDYAIGQENILLAKNDTDFIEKLDEVQVDGGLQTEGAANHTEVMDRIKKDGKEENVNDIIINDDSINEDDTLLANNETDFIENLDEAHLDGDLQIEGVVNHTEGNEKKKGYKGEKNMNDNSVKNAVTGFSNNDENYGMEKKNLTTATSNNVTTDDSSINIFNSSTNQMPSKELSAKTNMTINEGSFSGNNTVQNATKPTDTSNVRSVESEDKSKSLLNTTVVEQVPATETAAKGEPKLSPNASSVKEGSLGSGIIGHILLLDDNSEVNGTLSLNTSSTTTSIDDTAPSSIFGNVTISNETIANSSHTNITDTSIFDTDSFAGTSNSTTGSKSLELENITNDMTGAMNGNGSDITGNSLASTSNLTTGSKSLKFENITNDMTGAINESGSNITGNSLASTNNSTTKSKSEKLENVTNDMTDAMNEIGLNITGNLLASTNNSTTNSKSEKLENVTNDMTGAMNESGSNKTGNLRGFSGEIDGVHNS